MKSNRLTNPISPKTKTTRRNFGTLNLRIKQRLPYGKKRGKFTGKELDPETGLYYFGARYLDPKTSRWMSGDPAMGDYFPVAPVNDDAKKHNQNLPGQGGVFNYVNLHVYHYAGNNPVRYTDPNGMWINNGDGTHTAVEGDTLWGLYGADWQEKSGYTGDPTKLQIGEVVGKKIEKNQNPTPPPPASEAISLPSPTSTPTPNNSLQEAQSKLAGAEMLGVGVIYATAGGYAVTSTIAAAGTAEVITTAVGVAGGGGLLIVGLAVIWLGVDMLEGNGLDRTNNFINWLRRKSNE